MSNNFQPPPLLSHAQHQQQQQQPPIGLASQQLLRSKSLNDISNDSQISAFASDRFINLHPNCNNNNNGVVSGRVDPSATIAPMPMGSSTYIYNNNNNNNNQQNSNNVNLIHAAINGNNNNNNFYTNISFDNSRNLNSNQCSSRLPTSPQLPAPANLLNLCNPMAINLNGVTEQIGNLHL